MTTESIDSYISRGGKITKVTFDNWRTVQKFNGATRSMTVEEMKRNHRERKKQGHYLEPK